MLKTVMTRSAIIAFACSLSLSAYAIADGARRTIHIPSGDLAPALELLAKQSGSDLVYRPEHVQGFRTGGVDGELSTEAAVTKLLEGTPLILSTDSTGAMLIALPVDSGSNEAPRLRHAQANTPSPSERGGQKETELEEVIARGIPEILVKGTRSLNTDFRRSEDDVQPYVVIGADEIRNSQAENIQELLTHRLPMNNRPSGVRENRNGVAGTASVFDLRGLGAAQTLVLVNGRRMPRLAVGGELTQADLNGIPLSSIERIEILPSTAAAMYGGGATGGAINVILKRDYQGLEVGVGYKRPWDVNRYTRSVDLSGGLALFEGRTHVTFAGAFQEAVPLRQGDYDFKTRARELLMRNNPRGFPTFEPPTATLPNITSVDGTDLVLLDGRSLGSTFTHVPQGYAGAQSDDGDGLLANAGTFDLSLADTASFADGARASETASQTLRSGMVGVRHELTHRLEAYLDLSFLGNEGQFKGLINRTYAFIPAGVATNPFLNSIYVAVPTFYPGSPESQSTSDTRQALSGIIAHLPRDWVANLDLAWSRSEQRQRNDQDTVVVDFSLFDAMSNGTVDVLRDLSEYPVDYSPYLFTSVDSTIEVGPHRNSQRDFSLRLSGSAFQLPAGKALVTMTVSHRKERVPGTYDYTPASGYGSPSESILYTAARSQSVNSAFFEAVVPIVAGASAAPVLDLRVSARYDDYSTDTAGQIVYLSSPDEPLPELSRDHNEFSSGDYSVGLKYSPLPDVSIRSSVSTGFLPPSFLQLTPFDQERFCFLAFGGSGDPKRGFTTQCGYNVPGEPYDPVLGGLIDTVGGGNRELRPETSKSTTIGVVLTPRFIPGLRLSADYTRIRKAGEIAAVFDWDLVQYEELFPGRIIRGERLPGDPADWAGPIVGIDTRLGNLSRTRVDAIDYQLNYDVVTSRLGDFSFYSVATRQVHLARQFLRVSPLVEEVGDYNKALPWRGNVGLDWRYGAWGAGWNLQYFDSYPLYQRGAPPEVIQQIAMNQGGSARIPAQTYQDVYLTYRTRRDAASSLSVLSDIEIKLGIQNVLDTQPKLIAGQGAAPYSDTLLRRMSLSVRKTF